MWQHTELAAAEKIDRSYLWRVLRLTLLAPDIVEAILNGRHSEAVTLPTLMKPFSSAWKLQRWESPVAALDRRASTLLK